MSEPYVYMVEQIAPQDARILSAHATRWLAEQAVEKIIAKMPNRREWHKDPNRKRGSGNHGETVMMWGSRTYGPSSNHIVSLAIVAFKIDQGEIVARLGSINL
jgi:hypothetical protein